MRIPRWASSRQALTLSAPPPHPRQDPLPTRDSTSHIEWTQGSQFLAALVFNNNILCLQVHRRHFPSCVSLLPGLLIILSSQHCHVWVFQIHISPLLTQHHASKTTQMAGGSGYSVARVTETVKRMEIRGLNWSSAFHIWKWSDWDTKVCDCC